MYHRYYSDNVDDFPHRNKHTQDVFAHTHTHTICIDKVWPNQKQTNVIRNVEIQLYVEILITIL